MNDEDLKEKVRLLEEQVATLDHDLTVVFDVIKEILAALRIMTQPMFDEETIQAFRARRK